MEGGLHPPRKWSDVTPDVTPRGPVRKDAGTGPHGFRPRPAGSFSGKKPRLSNENLRHVGSNLSANRLRFSSCVTSSAPHGILFVRR